MLWYDPSGCWGVKKNQRSIRYVNACPDMTHKVDGALRINDQPCTSMDTLTWSTRSMDLMWIFWWSKSVRSKHTPQNSSHVRDPLSRQVKSTKSFIRTQTQNETLIHKHWTCSFKPLAPSVLSWSEKVYWARTCWRTYDTLSTFIHFGAMPPCVQPHFVQICMHICTFWRHPWTCASCALCRVVHLHFVEIWEWALYIYTLSNMNVPCSQCTYISVYFAVCTLYFHDSICQTSINVNCAAPHFVSPEHTFCTSTISGNVDVCRTCYTWSYITETQLKLQVKKHT